MKRMKKLVAIIIAVLITTWVSMSNQVFAADALTIGKKYYYNLQNLIDANNLYCVARENSLYYTTKAEFTVKGYVEIEGNTIKSAKVLKSVNGKNTVVTPSVSNSVKVNQQNALIAAILAGPLQKGYRTNTKKEVGEDWANRNYHQAQIALWKNWKSWVNSVGKYYGFAAISNNAYDTELNKKAQQEVGRNVSNYVPANANKYTSIAAAAAKNTKYHVKIYFLDASARNYQDIIYVETFSNTNNTPTPGKTEVDGKINISGCVWEDIANNKSNTINNRYDQNDGDKKVAGIKVHWKDASGNEIASGTTDANGNYTLSTTIRLTNHTYSYDTNTYNKINNSYVEFEYNGLKYTTVSYGGSGNNVNLADSSTSKAKENETLRTNLDNKFGRVENRAVYDGNTAIINNLPNTQVSDANYDATLAVSASTQNLATKLMEASERNNWTNKREFCTEHCSKAGQHVVREVTSGRAVINVYCDGTVKIKTNPDNKDLTAIINSIGKVKGNAINNYGKAHYYPAGEKYATEKDCLKGENKIYEWNIYNVNLGLVRREQPDAALVSDIEKVRVVQPNINQAGAQEYTYIYGNRNISNSTDNELYNYKVQFGNKYMQTYTRPISPSDIAFINYNKTEQLKVYVTYDIKIKNQSTTLPMKINSIVNYYDSDYIIHYGENTSNGWQDINWVFNKQIAVEGENDKETKTFRTARNSVNITLQPGATSDVIRIEFEVSQNKIRELQNTDAGFRFTNYTEISSYTTYYGENTKCAEMQPARECGKTGQQYAGIDSDSTPGNLDLSNFNTFEDDTDRAPSFKLVKDPNYRQVSGIVYEDTQTAESKNDNERLGNGQRDGNEKGVQGVKVELYDATTGQPAYLYYIEGNNSNRKPAVAYTNANGEYTFGDDGKSGVVVGNYFIKYTYGNADGVQSTIDGSTMINARNYKSTIITDSLIKDLMTGNRNDDRWYLDMDQDKATSIAVDVMQERLAQEELKNSTYKNAHNISADSKSFTIKMEYTKANQANVDANGGNFEHSWKTFNFGIIERPREDLVINKTISRVQVVLGNGQALIDGDPRSGDLSYVKGIGLGKEADRTAIFNANQNARRTLSIEMDQELIQGSTLKVWYLITLTNNSEKDYDYETNTDYYYYGTNKQGEALALADIVVDYMSSAMQCNVGSQFTESEEAIAGAVNNADWFKYVNKNVATDAEFLKDNGYVSYKLSDADAYQAYETIKNNNLQCMVTNTFAGLRPGETKSSVIYASKILANSDNNAFDNHVEVIQRNAKTGRTIKGVEDNTRRQLENEMYQPGNYQPSLQSTGYKHEQDDDTVNVTITPPTGVKNYTTIYIISATVGLVVIAGVIVLIKKRFMKN